MYKADDLINWRMLSSALTGSPEKIRKGKIPKKYREAVDKLLDYVEYWQDRHKK